MAMNDKKQLHTGWRVTLDIGENPSSDSVISLGSFHTITEFWRLFNNLGTQQSMDLLPDVCNFRMSRTSIASDCALTESQCMSILTHINQQTQ